MKGILLLTRRGRRRLNKKEIVYFLHRYGIDVLLGIALLAGMIFGAVCAGSADKTLMQGLDFLFTSDFQSRCSQSVLSAFAASLTANFMFFLANFLLAALYLRWRLYFRAGRQWPFPAAFLQE